MWSCANCSHTIEKRPSRKCGNCGLVLAGKWTHQKYEILEDYCHPLSLIMRNQEIPHYFIDACAGSGFVQSRRKDKLIDGSPLIMAKTRGYVDKTIKDKSKEPSVRCKFIERDKHTFKLLESFLEPHQNFVDCYKDDCNDILDDVLDEVAGAFAFVYIDPFGVGNPTIDHETIERVLERDFTELFLHFSWEAVSRMAGQLENINHTNDRRRETARTTVSSLDSLITEEWREIERKNLSPHRRKKEYVELYESILSRYYSEIEKIRIPIGSKNPIYYLFFTTRNETGRKIMKSVMDRKKRKGAIPLDEFM